MVIVKGGDDKVKMRKLLCVVMTCAILVSCFSINAGAVDPDAARATGRFSMEVPGGTLTRAKSSFPLEAGETVTIKASYSPFSASVDFGLIAPDGYFYYINVSDGSFDETIEVDQRGNYTFAVRNNSTSTISVSGYVNY